MMGNKTPPFETRADYVDIRSQYVDLIQYQRYEQIYNPSMTSVSPESEKARLRRIKLLLDS